MRINLGSISLFISFLLVSTCASMQVKLPVKYDLGDKLEQVQEIQDMRLGGGRSPSFTIFKEHEEFDYEPAPDIIARRDTFTLSENKNEWIKVDMQSLILRNGPDEFYLLVLQSPVYNLMEVDTISFVNLLNVIRAKQDLVGIGGQRYVIERIYKIDGNDKMLDIKNRISANAENTKNADPLDKSLGDAMVALVKKDYKKAVELLEPLAEKNNVRAKTLLAPLIFKGLGVEKDTNKGLAMIMDAARQGDEDARKIAVDLNHELASMGDEKAMYNMGYMCLNWGEDSESSGQCLRWLEKAAELGHPRSAKFLAYIYKNGKYGITADQTKADEWAQVSQQLQQPK